MMNGWYGNGWDMGGWGMGGWVMMVLVFLLFWGGVVSLVIYLVRRSHSDQGTVPPRPAHHEAERILAERFARGEIDEEEFNKRRATLRRME